MKSRICGIWLIGLLAAPHAQAQTVYKCVAKGKPTIFQNHPCSATHRQAKAVSYTPDAVSTYRPDVRSRPYATSQSTTTYNTITLATQPSACEAARQTRDAWLGTNNQGGNYDLRVQLNDAVQRACN